MTPERVQHYVRTIREEAERLANDPDAVVGAAVPIEDRMAFRAEWTNEMGRFALLFRAYDAKRLDAASVAELGRMAGTLADLLPLLVRLRLELHRLLTWSA